MKFNDAEDPDWPLRSAALPVVCPQQSNGNDCGVFTCKFAELIMNKVVMHSNAYSTDCNVVVMTVCVSPWVVWCVQPCCDWTIKQDDIPRIRDEFYELGMKYLSPPSAESAPQVTGTKTDA